MSNSLEGKIAVITGASKGMGRDAKKVNQMYKKNVEGFYKYIYKLIGKLM